MSARSLLLFAITCALWGGSYLFMKVALDDDVSVGFILFIRTALGAAVLVPIALRAGALRPAFGRRGPLALLAATQVVLPFALIVLGEQWIDSGLTGVLVAAAPIFMALIAPWFDPEERSSGRALVGIAVGMAGVVLLLVADLGGLGGTAVIGGLMVLGAAATYAFAPLLYKRSFAAVPHVGAMAAVMLVSAVVYLPAALVALPTHAPGVLTWLGLFVLGAGGTGVAFWCFYELMEDIGAARASVVAYIAPMFAVLYGVLLLEEAFTVFTLCGMTLILGGSWLAAHRAVDAGMD